MNPSMLPHWQFEVFERKLEELLRRGKDFHAFSIVTPQGPIFQKTYNHYSAQGLHPLYSITKSVTAWVSLVAFTQAKVSLETPVMAVLPRADWQLLLRVRPLLSSLQLKHLLHMQAGFIWQEVERFYDADNPFRNFLSAQDPAGYLLAQPMSSAPGREVNYNSAVSHLLGLCAKAVAGQPLAQFAREKLFAPLGIQHFDWEVDTQGDAYGGHGLSLDLAGTLALGQLLAGQGWFGSQQLLPEAVVAALQVPEVNGFRGYRGYGYGMWHVTCAKAHFVSAFGHGGQRIYWNPKQQYALVFLGAVRPEFGLQEQLIQALLGA